MVLPLNHMPLPGSVLATPSAPCLGPVPGSEQLDVVIRLRPECDGDGLVELMRFAAAEGLRVLDVQRDGGFVVELRGSSAAVGRAFGVRLLRYAGAGGPFRARRGLLRIPVTLAAIVGRVDGLDERPPAGRRSCPPSHPVSAAPRVRAGRARPEPAGPTGAPAPPSTASRPRARDGGDEAREPGLAVVLHLPVRPVPAPLDDEHAAPSGRAPARPVALAAARTWRRGPLVRAAADQRARRLARQLARESHPAGVDRS